MISYHVFALIKKKHFTFRLEEDIYHKLELESDRKNISPTVLMAKLAKNYLNRDKFLEELEFIPTPKDFLKILLDGRDKEKIIEDGKNLGIIKLGEYITYFYHKKDKNTILKFLELYLPTQGTFRKENNNGTISYTTHHNISKEYSLFLKSFLFHTLEGIMGTRINIMELSPNLLSFNFDVS